MKDIWIVTKFETIRQLKKPSFWIALLLLPLFLLGVILLSASSGYKSETALEDIQLINKEDTIGIIDNAKILDLKEIKKSLPDTKIKPISDNKVGLEEVKNGEIKVLYEIPKDFLESNSISATSLADRKNLLADYTSPIKSILTANAIPTTPIVNIISLTGQFEVSDTTIDQDGNSVNLFGQAAIPILILAIFYVLICVFGNRLLMTVVEEKENRISEMILTSTTVKTLIMGKIIALVLLGFLQILILIIPIGGYIISQADNPIISSILAEIEINPVMIIGNLLLLVLSYFLLASACTLVGALVPTAREASNYIGIVVVGIIAPLFFIESFLAEPSTITYILSYIPLSQPIALMLRNAFGTLPTFELLIGLTELAIFSLLTVSLTVKCFEKNATNFTLSMPTFSPRKYWKKK